MREQLIGKEKDDFTLFVNRRELVINSGKLIKTMDTGADAATAEIAWEPGFDDEIDAATAPYSFAESAVYLGGFLQSEQILYNVTPKLTASGRIKDLEFFSKTADIIDSTVLPPYEMNNVRLTDRARQQCTPFGINVIVGEDAAKALNETRRVVSSVGYGRQFPIGFRLIQDFSSFVPINLQRQRQVSRYVTDEKKFSRVSAEPTDTIFDHLVKLASERGLLLSCTKYGDLLITKANVNAASVGTIEEEVSPLASEYIATFKGRDRWNTYRSIASSSSKRRTAGASLARDMAVKAPRLLAFQADDNIPGEASSAAEWRKNKSAADAMTVNFPVSSWYAPNKKLWDVNTAVTVVSKTLGIKNGFTFLITQVEFIFDNGGSRAVLQLKPPTVYSTGAITEPWLS
jgi:prophage tail gpP-like protein